MNQNKIFRDYLEAKGLKLTKPRSLILEAAFAVHDHFSAEQLYQLIKRDSDEVSLATVYRTIPLLIEAGLLQQSLRSASGESYEHILGHPKHIHWICSQCGSVVETDIKEIKQILKTTAQKLNFEVGDIKLNIHGLCWKCQESENENQ